MSTYDLAISASGSGTGVAVGVAVGLGDLVGVVVLSAGALADGAAEPLGALVAVPSGALVVVPAGVVLPLSALSSVTTILQDNLVFFFPSLYVALSFVLPAATPLTVAYAFLPLVDFLIQN